ncbi:MAG: hypothetical protein GY788_32405, partial [bacterium]|nr:hypothetical protein [bacterium]
TPVSLNRYTYGYANPLLYWDPDGRLGNVVDGAGAPIIGFGDDGTPIRAPITQDRKDRHNQTVAESEQRIANYAYQLWYIEQYQAANPSPTTASGLASEAVLAAMGPALSGSDAASMELYMMTGIPVGMYQEIFVDYSMWLAEDSVNYEWAGHLDGSDRFVVDSLGIYGLDNDELRQLVLESVSVEFLIAYQEMNGLDYGTCDSNACLLLASGSLAIPWVPRVSQSVASGVTDLAATETFFRAMSEADFAVLQETGHLPATYETFMSTSEEFASGFNGVLVEFRVQPGTQGALAEVGMRDVSRVATGLYPEMPMVSSGWSSTSAFFKGERGVLNIGLGNGKALDIFNGAIEVFWPVIR